MKRRGEPWPGESISLSLTSSKEMKYSHSVNLSFSQSRNQSDLRSLVILGCQQGLAVLPSVNKRDLTSPLAGHTLIPGLTPHKQTDATTNTSTQIERKSWVGDGNTWWLDIHTYIHIDIYLDIDRQIDSKKINRSIFSKYIDSELMSRYTDKYKKNTLWTNILYCGIILWSLVIGTSHRQSGY